MTANPSESRSSRTCRGLQMDATWVRVTVRFAIRRLYSNTDKYLPSECQGSHGGSCETEFTRFTPDLKGGPLSLKK